MIKHEPIISWSVAIVTGSSIIVGLYINTPVYIMYGLFILVLYTLYLKALQKINKIRNVDIKKEAFKNSLNGKYKKLMTNDHTLVEQGFIDGANYMINTLKK